ncbi:MAG: hypothetical protein Ta2E_07960 [Mycoplasmoidaceae bacterium]|nr:MAG: hypothetical protein Ta2E_07960 [Mycoplasmoidaceae bacterium]
MKKKEKNISKQKIPYVKRVCCLIFCILGGIAIGNLAYYIIKIDNSTKISLNQISGPNKLVKKGDQIVYEAKVKNPKGITTWNEPKHVNGVSYEYSNNGQHNLMFVTALVDMQYEPLIDITATNNNKEASASIASSYVPFKALPVTSEYFTFDTTDAIDDTIVGFSPAVVANPSIIVNSGYNSMDFTTNPDIKYVDANASFARAVFANWKVEKMSFSGLKFKFRSITGTEIGSAYKMFSQYSFPFLIELDLSYADFASAITVDYPNKSNNIAIVTAADMFDDASFDKLHTLKINNAIFASINMQKPSTNVAERASIATARNTFSANYNGQNSMFKSLAILDLSNTVFATDSMGCGPVDTAYNTFRYANMNNLIILNLDNAIFATEKMSTYVGSGNASATDLIETAYGTFLNAKMMNLSNLDLSSAVFSTSNMIESTNLIGAIRTGLNTFSEADLSGLKSLDLSNLEFASENNYVKHYYSGYYTFNEAKLPSITSLNLDNTKFAAKNMAITPSSNEPVITGFNSFYNADLSSLKKLDLSKTVFVVEETTNGKLRTASDTFREANLDSLESLDLSTNMLQCDNMTSGTAEPMYQTFAQTQARNVKNIYLPSNINNSIIYNYKYTFDLWKNCFSSTGTIHWEDYNSTTSPLPVNWNPTWFDTWTWTNT